MCKTTIQKDGYLNTYFHPWEFTDLDQDRFGFPGYVRRNTGIEMIKRFDRYISFLKGQGYSFGTFSEFIQTI